MTSILPTLLSYLLLYKYITLFVVVFSAAVIVPFPDSTMLVATGAFASQGYFSMAFAFIVTLSANVLGDIVGYSLTRRWGYSIVKERHIKKLPYFSKVEQFVRDYAGQTILFSRFVGTVGPLVNFLAGLSKLPFQNFLFFDIVGNTLDIAFLLVFGYSLGQYWQDFSGIMSTLGWICFIMIMLYAIIKISISTKKSHTMTSQWLP